jgi:AraC-like DNA-binding protein
VAARHTNRVLFRADGIEVSDFRCQEGVHAEGAEERNRRHAIVLVRSGVFRRTVGRDRHVADANHVLFFNRGEPYRVAHPVPGGDVCTVLSLSPELALDAASRLSPRGDADPEAPFAFARTLATPRAYRLQYELLALARRPEALPIAVEDLVAALAAEVVKTAHAARDGHVEAEGDGRRKARERAEAVKEILNESLEDPPSLGEIATRLECSPFHLSRTFRREAGLPLRRYVSRLRVRSGAARIAEGACRLTSLALDLGFSDQSHFTNVFRKEWGVPPSALGEAFRDDGSS